MRSLRLPILLSLLLVVAACGSAAEPEGDAQPTDQVLLDLPDVALEDTAQPDQAKPPVEVAEPSEEAVEDTGDEDAEPPRCVDTGSFGCDCITGADCKSGYCVNTAEGKICTQFCVDSCPEGFLCEDVSTGGSDPVYLCMPAYLNICKPCKANGECYDLNDNGDRCIDFGSTGAFCGRKCLNDDHCPDGYQCAEVPTIDGKSAMQCLPISGSCECNDYFIVGGFTTRCVRANGYGTCYGERFCTEEGLSDCDAPTPESEQCDLVDNDCNGQTDEGLDEPEESSCKTVGACATGVDATCVNGAWACSYDQVADYEPIEKSCDGVDNDCDGQTDEQLTSVADSTCLQVGACTDGVAALCSAGGWTCNYQGVVGYEATEATCDGVDNDCDGQTDEGLGGGVCELTNDYGTCPGSEICKADGTLYCQGTPPALEICDGLDNDCDGVTDQGFPDSDSDGKADCVDPDDDNDGVLDDGDSSGSVGDNPCVAGTYAGCDDNCRLLFNPNQADWDGDGKGDLCDEDRDGDGDPNVTDCAPDDPTISKFAKEACFDAADNDCDGLTDEEGGQNCSLFYRDGDQDGFGVLTDAKCLCIAVVPYTASQVGDCADDDAAIKPAAPEACNGKDENCNGQTDEGFPNTDGDLLADCVDPDDDNDTILDDGDGDGTYTTPCAPGQTTYCDDNCRLNENAGQDDQDGDGTGDACENDIDGDGDPNATDCAPSNPAIFHGQAEPCDEVDNDCDGKTDEGENNAGCRTFYRDADGDTFGDASMQKCLCGPDYPNKYTAETKTDCCDSDANVRPTQAAYFSSASQCGGFDYDCNGVEQKELTVTGKCSGLLCDYTAGWSGSVPACGQTGNWLNGCKTGFFTCDEQKISKTQMCR